MDEFEQREEGKLLCILETSSSNLQLKALKRLIKIYRKRPENESIYKFMESHQYSDSESTNFLLECLIELLDCDEAGSLSSQRIERIYQNETIIEALVSLTKYENTQTNALILLSQILQNKPCKEKWIDGIVGIFCHTKRRSIENLAGKILIAFIKFNCSFSYSSFIQIRQKLARILPDGEFPDSVLLDLKNVWEEHRHCKVENYVNVLEKKDLYMLFKTADQKFIKENIAEIDEKVSVISRLYTDAIISATDDKAGILEHLLMLLESSQFLAEEIYRSDHLDVLYDLIDDEDKDVVYLATKIISKILIIVL